MKKLICTIAIMSAFACIKLNAQNTFPASGSTGIGTSAPNASSILEVKSTTKGMLTPRMTKAQRDLIASPATGLLIFQTNSTPGFYFFDGSVWKAVSSTSFSNKSLSNLTAPTQVNVNLSPKFNDSLDLGSTTNRWKDLYLQGDIIISGTHAISFPTGNSTIVGFNAGNTGMTGSSNSFFGNGCGQNITSGGANSFFGRSAGASNSTGTNNTFMGSFAGDVNGSGAANSFFGANAGGENTASGNSFFGCFAGDANTTGTRNSFFGQDAGGANTTANDNSIFGAFAGDANTTGTQNAFFGSSSGGANNTGTDNSFYGFNSGLANTTGTRNSFFGKNAGAANTVANDNSFFGANAGDANTTGIQNSFFGTNAGGANTQASNNSFFGYTTGDNNTIGGFNAFFGTGAGTSNVVGNNNAFFGAGAGLSSTANDNSCFGTSAGEATTTGAENSFFGKDAGLDNENGTGDVAFGFQAGKFRTGNSFCTYVGYQSDNVTSINFSNSNVFGHLSRSTGFNEVRIGNTSIGSIGGFVGFTNLSDGRYKKNVKQNVPGLEFINKLKPVTYTMDVKGLQTFLHENDNLNESAKAINLKAAEDKEKIVYTGFIAQEVEAAAKELNYNFSGVDKPQTDEALYGLRYSEFTVPLVKAVQELSKEDGRLRTDDGRQKAEIESLKAEIENLKSCIESLCNNSDKQSSVISHQSSDLLFQNSPNPFSEKTTIHYEINSEFSSAKIVIRNLDGAVMMEQIISARGKNEIEVNARSLSAGTYTYTLEINNVSVDTKLMVITK